MDAFQVQDTSASLADNLTENKKIRFSGVELLRILAIFLICISHAVQTSEQFVPFGSVLSIGTVFLKILRYSGQIGNILFVICSSYFLLDSKRTKGEKALNLLLDSMVISLIVLVGFILGGYKFSAAQILAQFLPDLWFIPVYVLFYAVHPILNLAINSMEQKVHFTLVFVMLVILGVIRIFTSIVQLNSLVNFIEVYFVVAYMKRYMAGYCKCVKKNAIAFCAFFGAFIILVVVKYIAGMNVAFFRSLTFDDYSSPILLPALLSLFNLFNSMKFKNKAINYFASCSLYVYCIHENPLLRTIIRPMFYRYVFDLNYDLYVVWILLCAVGMFVGAYILSVLYKESAHRLTSVLSKKICLLITNIINFFYDKSVERNERIEQELIENEAE